MVEAPTRRKKWLTEGHLAQKTWGDWNLPCRRHQGTPENPVRETFEGVQGGFRSQVIDYLTTVATNIASSLKEVFHRNTSLPSHAWQARISYLTVETWHLVRRYHNN